MATLSIPQNGQATKGRNRARKPVPSVDLTAMVDLAFLLITFFMLTTSLSKLQAMDVVKPVNDIPQQPYPASRTVTILLGRDNRIIWYKGEVVKAKPQRISYRAMKSMLNQNKKEISDLYNNDKAKFMIVIIKPTEKSTYKNFVDALDEMSISNIRSYLIDDDGLSSQERTHMESLGGI